MVTTSNQTTSGFNAIRARMRQMVNDARVHARGMWNQFVSRGAFGPALSRIGGLFARAGGAAGQFFMNNFRTIAVGAAGTIGLAIAATLAPALVAALGSAILLGLGGGVLAAGIGLVMGNEKVAGAAKGFRDRFLDRDLATDRDAVAKATEKVEAIEARLAKARALGSASGAKSAQFDLKKAKEELAAAQKQLAEGESFNKRNVSVRDLAQPFVEPAKRMFETFTTSLDRVMPKIGQAFEKMAPLVDKLAPAFATMVENMLPGLEKGLAGAVPLFEKLAEKLPSIGTALSQFFELLGDAGPELARVFAVIIDVLNILIVWIGGTINFAAKFYTTMIDFWKTLRDVAMDALRALVTAVLNFFGTMINGAAKAFSWMPGIGPKLEQAAKDFNTFRDRVNAALAGIHDRIVTVHAQVRGAGINLRGAQAQLSGEYSSGIGGRASGGMASGLKWVGERGQAELVDFNQGRVYNAQQSRQIAAQAGGGGATVVNVAIAPGPAAGAARWLADGMLLALSTNALQLTAGGQRVEVAR